MNEKTHYPYRQGTWNYQEYFECFCGKDFRTLRKLRNHVTRMTAPASTRIVATDQNTSHALSHIEHFFKREASDSNRSVQIAESVWEQPYSTTNEQVIAFITFLKKSHTAHVSTAAGLPLAKLHDELLAMKVRRSTSGASA